MSLRKSSRRRNGSKSDVLPKPNARRRCTPAPSRVGLARASRLTGRMDMFASNLGGHGRVLQQQERIYGGIGLEARAEEKQAVDEWRCKGGGPDGGRKR